MALFLPTVAVERVTDITPKLIRAMKVSAIILDVDNTLAIDGAPEPLSGTVEWAQHMISNGIKLIIMSNNNNKRVEPFAAQYSLPFITLAFKPFPVAYFRAIRKLRVKRREAVVVGDQIFTDVIGSNLSFMKSILLVPIHKEKSLSFKIRRGCERPLRYIMKASNRGKKYFN
ncbi:MAG: YqeG family IIIA-type phosphatase [Caproiciproducens sp.]|nr:YqeG family IIIA-type phosphatase [Caproiciproducens sp.]